MGTYIKSSWRYGEVFHKGSKDLISRSIEKYGEWAELEVRALSQILLELTGGFFDVGAHIGTVSVGVAKNTGRSVLAFEPDPNNFYLLNKNICGVSYLVEVVNKYVGANNELVNMAMSLEDNSGSICKIGLGQDVIGPVISASTCLLDDYFKEKPALIKVDVEGAFSDVADGALRLIEFGDAVWAVEFNSALEALAIWNAFPREKYVIYALIFAAFNTDNYAGNDDNIFGDAVEISALVVPLDLNLSLPVIDGVVVLQLKSFDCFITALSMKPQYMAERYAESEKIRVGY